MASAVNVGRTRRPGQPPRPSSEPTRVPQPAAGGQRRGAAAPGGGREHSALSGRARAADRRRLLVAVRGGRPRRRDRLWSTPSAEPTVQAFLLDWQDNQYKAAAALTTGSPAAVTAALDSAYRQLDAAAFYLSMGPISQHGHTAPAHFHASSTSARTGRRGTTGPFGLRRTPSGLEGGVEPERDQPGLRPGLRLAVVSTTPARALCSTPRARRCSSLVRVYVVGVRPDRLKNPAGHRAGARPGHRARRHRAARLDPGRGREAVPRAGHPAAGRLPPAGARAGEDSRPDHLPQKCACSTASPRPWSARSAPRPPPQLRDQGIAYRPGPPWACPGCRSPLPAHLAGSPGTEVVAENRLRPAGVGAEELARAARRGAHHDRRRRAAAADRARGHGPRLRGDRRRAGLHRAHSRRRRPRGAGAAADRPAGRALPARAGPSPSSRPRRCWPAACRRTGTSLPAGQPRWAASTSPTYRPDRLSGTSPFAADFAHACGTAFATGLSLGMHRSLTNAAKGFGLGAQWQLPLPSFSGHVVVPGGVARLAAATIGQGRRAGEPAGPWPRWPPAGGLRHLARAVAGDQAATRGMRQQARFSASTIASLRA